MEKANGCKNNSENSYITKANYKYIKNYDKNKESSHLTYWEVHNLYGYEASQEFTLNNFEWIEDNSQFNEGFLKHMIKDIFLKLIFNILKIYMNFIMICHCLPERMETEKLPKNVANLHYKTEYFIHVRNLKQTLNYGLVFKKSPRIIRLNQNAWLKPYIHMNKDLRKKVENDFDKYFYKSMIDAIFQKWEIWEI